MVISDTARARAIARLLIPAACIARAWSRRKMRLGRPQCLPRFWAAATPAFTRSTIMPRSNSAMAANRCRMNRPIGEFWSCIDVLRHGDESHFQAIQFEDAVHQVLQAAPKSIDLPHQHYIDLAELGIGHEFVECRSALLHSAHAMIDVLDNVPARAL